jgi:L-alanine-DL-glutamate epimerase-like enolase superfamily enzyme
MQLLLHHVELPLRYPFTIARGSKTMTRSLVVELRDGGLSGYGEAPESGYYGYTVERARAALEAARGDVEGDALDDPEELWRRIDPQLRVCRAAQAALDQAAWDLWGKRRGRPLYELWGLDIRDNPPSDYTIGIDRMEVMVEKLLEFADWPVFKIKLGTPRDIEIVEQLREHTAAPFRVDANCGWAADEAIRASHTLQTLGVELIEQPLPADNWTAMRQVCAESALPLVADESCVVEADVQRCAEYFHGVNVKLCKCGGLTPARRMLQHARRLGLKTMIGCMTETTVGVSALAQLLPLADHADLDGSLLLARDVAAGVTFERGVVRYADAPGTGVEELKIAD